MTGWIGTYTSSNGTSTGSSGIYAFQWDTQQGVMSGIHPVGTTTNPSFLALHPSGRFLYAVNEDAPSSGTDHLTAFAVGDANSSESLRVIGTVPSQGLAPCHLSIDASGKWLFVANYIIDHEGLPVPAGHVSSNGTLPRFFNIDPDGKFLIAANQGSGDLVTFAIDPSSGALTRVGSKVSVPAPVSFVFAPALPR
jgi:6-phosphogluconolactonase